MPSPITPARLTSGDSSGTGGRDTSSVGSGALAANTAMSLAREIETAVEQFRGGKLPLGWGELQKLKQRAQDLVSRTPDQTAADALRRAVARIDVMDGSLGGDTGWDVVEVLKDHRDRAQQLLGRNQGDITHGELLRALNLARRVMKEHQAHWDKSAVSNAGGLLKDIGTKYLPALEKLEGLQISAMEQARRSFLQAPTPQARQVLQQWRDLLNARFNANNFAPANGPVLKQFLAAASKALGNPGAAPAGPSQQARGPRPGDIREADLDPDGAGPKKGTFVGVAARGDISLQTRLVTLQAFDGQRWINQGYGVRDLIQVHKGLVKQQTSVSKDFLNVSLDEAKRQARAWLSQSPQVTGKPRPPVASQPVESIETRGLAIKPGDVPLSGPTGARGFIQLLDQQVAPDAQRYLKAGNALIDLRGSDLQNYVGVAMNLTPNAAPVRGAGNQLLYQGEALQAIGTVSDAIRTAGGEAPQVRAVPVYLRVANDKMAKTTIFRVQGRDGRERVVDNVGRTYESLQKWRERNQLGAVDVFLPQGGQLQGRDGKVVLEAFNNRRFDNTALPVVRGGVAILGAAAGVATMLGTGGVAAPLVMAGGAVFSAVDSSATLADRLQHKQPVSLTNQQARAAWLDFGAGWLGVAAIGTGLKLVAKASDLADLLSLGNGARDLQQDWNKLSPEQRLLAGAQLGFWASMFGASQLRGGLFNLDRLLGSGQGGADGSPGVKRPPAVPPDTRRSATTPKGSPGTDPRKVQIPQQDPGTSIRKPVPTTGQIPPTPPEVSNATALDALTGSTFSGSGVPPTVQQAFRGRAEAWAQQQAQSRGNTAASWLQALTSDPNAGPYRADLLRPAVAEHLGGGNQRLQNAVAAQLNLLDERALKNLVVPGRDGQPQQAAIDTLRQALLARWSEDFQLPATSRARLEEVLNARSQGKTAEQQRADLVNLANSRSLRDTLIKQATQVQGTDSPTRPNTPRGDLLATKPSGAPPGKGAKDLLPAPVFDALQQALKQSGVDPRNITAADHGAVAQVISGQPDQLRRLQVLLTIEGSGGPTANELQTSSVINKALNAPFSSPFPNVLAMAGSSQKTLSASLNALVVDGKVDERELNNVIRAMIKASNALNPEAKKLYDDIIAGLRLARVSELPNQTAVIQHYQRMLEKIEGKENQPDVSKLVQSDSLTQPAAQGSFEQNNAVVREKQDRLFLDSATGIYTDSNGTTGSFIGSKKNSLGEHDPQQVLVVNASNKFFWRSPGRALDSGESLAAYYDVAKKKIVIDSQVALDSKAPKVLKDMLTQMRSTGSGDVFNRNYQLSFREWTYEEATHFIWEKDNNYYVPALQDSTNGSVPKIWPPSQAARDVLSIAKDAKPDEENLAKVFNLARKQAVFQTFRAGVGFSEFGRMAPHMFDGMNLKGGDGPGSVYARVILENAGSGIGPSYQGMHRDALPIGSEGISPYLPWSFTPPQKDLQSPDTITDFSLIDPQDLVKGKYPKLRNEVLDYLRKKPVVVNSEADYKAWVGAKVWLKSAFLATTGVTGLGWFLISNFNRVARDHETAPNAIQTLLKATNDRAYGHNNSFISELDKAIELDVNKKPTSFAQFKKHMESAAEYAKKQANEYDLMFKNLERWKVAYLKRKEDFGTSLYITITGQSELPKWYQAMVFDLENSRKKSAELGVSALGLVNAAQSDREKNELSRKAQTLQREGLALQKRNQELVNAPANLEQRVSELVRGNETFIANYLKSDADLKKLNDSAARENNIGKMRSVMLGYEVLRQSVDDQRSQLASQLEAITQIDGPLANSAITAQKSSLATEIGKLDKFTTDLTSAISSVDKSIRDSENSELKTYTGRRENINSQTSTQLRSASADSYVGPNGVILPTKLDQNYGIRKPEVVLKEFYNTHVDLFKPSQNVVTAANRESLRPADGTAAVNIIRYESAEEYIQAARRIAPNWFDLPSSESGTSPPGTSTPNTQGQ